MSRPTLYSFPGDYRAAKCLVTAQYAKVDVVTPAFKIGTDNQTDEFKASFPIGKVPAMKTSTGPVAESGAIARYLARFNDQQLLGRTPMESALIDQWVEVAGSDVDVLTDAILSMCFGWTPEDKKLFSSAMSDLKKILQALNTVFEDQALTYLVGDRVTLADIALGVPLAHLYKLVVDKNMRERAYPNVTRWLDTLVHQEPFQVVLGEVTFCDKPLKAGQTVAYAEYAGAAIASAKEQSARLSGVGHGRHSLVVSPLGFSTDMQDAIKHLRKTQVEGAEWLQHLVKDYAFGVQHLVIDVEVTSPEALDRAKAAVLGLKQYFQAVEVSPGTV